jgi:hypothetical protein
LESRRRLVQEGFKEKRREEEVRSVEEVKEDQRKKKV